MPGAVAIQSMVATRKLTVALTVVASLAACGGGDDLSSSASPSTGASGSAGVSGAAGSSGSSAAASGASAAAGTAGHSGVSGAGGTSGHGGASGHSGASGTSGSGGASASAGASGFAGASGSSGASGGSGTSGLGGASGSAGSSGSATSAAAPHAVEVARTTSIPACTVFVDGANTGSEDGTAANPHKTITAAVAAADNGAIICVAEGTYAEALAPGTKYFTLAGGFQSGQSFQIRDSSIHVTKAQGDGTNIFFDIIDPGPTDGQLSAVDGFEITGYSQGIVRDIYYPQRFDITNDFIHDNSCIAPALGGGFFVNNVTGTISGNVIARNSCSRGGGGAVDDSTNSSTVSITNNWVDSNAGNEPDISHGGGLYLFAHTLTITANAFTGNTVTAWGAGLYVGADTGGGKETTAQLSWNIYRDNRAAIYGGGFFCDDSAHCISDHEVFAHNCGGNVFLDCGPDAAGATIASFDHMTNTGALTVDCAAPGPGVQITKNNLANDSYSFTNSIFWGNAPGHDFEASCGSGCANVSVAVTYSDVQTTYAGEGQGVAISFGAGVQTGVDPLFVAADSQDFHLRSTHGHWAPNGYVVDGTDSPGLKAGDPAGATTDNPPGAGMRTELGCFGNSVEASLVE